MERPHLLILDEPTNHLDIDSRRALTEALNDYAGAVILITHDRSLMELVADRLWMVADGTVKTFDGDMDDYARFVLDRARQAARGPAKSTAQPLSPAAPRPAVGPLKRKLEAAETALARENRLAEELDRLLADPGLYARDAATAAELGQRRARVAERVTLAERVWIEAAERYEAAMANA